MVSLVYYALVLLSFAHAVQSATTFVDVGINLEDDPYTTGFKAVKKLLMENEPKLFVQGHQFFAVRRPVFLGQPDKIIRIHLSGSSCVNYFFVCLSGSFIGQVLTSPFFFSYNCRRVGSGRQVHRGVRPRRLVRDRVYQPRGPLVLLGKLSLHPGLHPALFRGELRPDPRPRGHQNLPQVPLGRQAARQAVSMLASHTSGADESGAKQGLGRLIVMLAEAQRIEPIKRNVNASWEGTIHMPPRAAKYCVNWGHMSKFLLEWKNSGKDDKAWGKSNPVVAQLLKDEAGVSGPKDALRVVEGLLRPYPE